MTTTDGQRWLRQSRSDLKSAGILLSSSQFDGCAFYAQQAAEKALKASLLSLGDSPWGHRLVDLLDRVADLTSREMAEDLRRAALSLNGHYVSARYPDAFPVGTPSEHYDQQTAEGALRCARRLVQFAEIVMESGRQASSTCLNSNSTATGSSRP